MSRGQELLAEADTILRAVGDTMKSKDLQDSARLVLSARKLITGAGLQFIKEKNRAAQAIARNGYNAGKRKA